MGSRPPNLLLLNSVGPLSSPMYKCANFLPLLLVSKAAGRFTAISSRGAEYVDLGGEWRARNRNGSISISANVPGLIQTDLHAAGVLTDPFLDNNCSCYQL